MPTSKKKPGSKNKKPPVSAFSTGGGGVCFEHVVGSLFLSHLLLGIAPPGASDFDIAEVRWQRKEIDGIPLDDLAICLNVPHAKQGRAFMALQLKHDIAWGTSENNAIFQAVMRACWDTFCHPNYGQFDRFGVVVGVEKADYRTYRAVIQTAQNCASGKDFVQVIQKGGVKGQNFLSLMRSALDDLSIADGSGPLSDAQIWKFLRQFCLLRFDLLETDSQSLAQCCTNLQLGIPLISAPRAREVWNDLVRLVAESNRNAGSCDKALLREKLARHLPKVTEKPIVEEPTAEASQPVTIQGIAELFAQLNNQSQGSNPSLKMVDDNSNLSPRRIEEERIDAQVDAARAQIQSGHSNAARHTLENIQAENPLSPRLQFRIKANLGICAWMLGEDATAVELCRAAYHQDPNNPNAMVIGAQAELLDEKPDAAISLCERALQCEPRSTDAALIYIQALIAAGLQEELQAWLEQERWITDEANCAPPLARLDLQNGDINAAIARLERFQKAPQTDTNTEVAFHLAWLFLTRAYDLWKKTPLLSWKLPTQMKRDLERCAELYQQVIEAEKGSDDFRQKILCLCNRAVALMFLSRDEEASEMLEQASRLDPQNASIWVNAGWMHVKNNDFEAALIAQEKASSLFDSLGTGRGKELREGGERWENVRGLAVAYVKTNNWSKLRLHLAALMRWDGQALTDEDAVPLDDKSLTYDFCGLIGTWLQALDEATQQDLMPMQKPGRTATPQQFAIIKWLETKFPDHPEAVGLRADFAWLKGRYPEAIKLMRRVVELASKEHNDRPTLILAEALFHLGRYRVSASLFKATLSESVPTPHRQHYALALLRSGNLVEAHRLAVYIRQLEPKNGKKHAPAVPLFSEIEAECADFVGDLETALRLRRELMEVEPHRSDHALEVALLELKMGNRAKAQAVLQATQLLSPESDPPLAMRFAFAKGELRLAGALELGYKIWRAYPHDDALQISYLNLFHRVTTENDPLLRPELVGVDCAVTFKTRGSNQPARTRILVRVGKPSELKEYEEDIEDSRVQPLLGKRAGDVVTIARQWDDDIQVEITEIRHKFVYAFQEVIHRIERGDVQHESFKVGNVEIEGGFDQWKEKMAKMLLRTRRGWEQLAQLYRRQPIPLSAIALIKDRFCLELWEDVASVGGRFYSNEGSMEELLEDSLALISHESLVLDETALGCICLLNIEKQVVKRFPRLLVPQIVREQLVLQLQREIRSGDSMGYLTHNGRGLSYIEVTPEDHERRRKWMEQIVRFVDRHCEVVPVPSLLQAGDWIQALGKGAVAAVLLAKERQVPVWSDDARLRQFGAVNYDARCTYYFPVFRQLRSAGWELDAMQSALCRLSVHGYSYVLMPAELLLWRIRQDNLTLTNETRVLLFRAFNGRDVNLGWAAGQVAHLIDTLWHQTPKLLDSQYRAILESTLASYVFERSTDIAIQQLLSELKAHFHYEPVAFRRISNDIAQWQKEHLRIINAGSLLQVGRVAPATLEETLILHPASRRFR